MLYFCHIGRAGVIGVGTARFTAKHLLPACYRVHGSGKVFAAVPHIHRDIRNAILHRAAVGHQDGGKLGCFLRGSRFILGRAYRFIACTLLGFGLCLHSAGSQCQCQQAGQKFCRRFHKISPFVLVWHQYTAGLFPACHSFVTGRILFWSILFPAYTQPGARCAVGRPGSACGAGG